MRHFIAFFVVICTAFLGTQAFATVGGPETVSHIRYNTQENAYKYALENNGGIGGFKIMKYDMDDNTETSVTTFAKQYDQEQGYLFDRDAKDTMLAEGNYLPLQEIALDKVPVQFDFTLQSMYVINDFSKSPRDVAKDPFPFVEKPEEYGMEGSISKFGWTIRVMVNDTLQRKVDVTTCRLDSFNFRGFSLPGKNFAIVIASANRSDCFEGGYVGERVFPVKYVTVTNDMFLGSYSDIFKEETYEGNGLKLQKTPHGVRVDLTEADLAKAINTKGFAYYQKKDYQTAIAYFQYAYDHAKDTYLLPLYNLAATQAKIGQTDSAIRNLQKLVGYVSGQTDFCHKIQTDADFDTLGSISGYQQILQQCNGVAALYLPQNPLTMRIIALIQNYTQGNIALERSIGQKIAKFLTTKISTTIDTDFRTKLGIVEKELQEYYK